MKLYAIRDRLIDYFKQPFVGPSDAQVKAALANMINNPETSIDVQQAPQHFELWSLAEINEETGHVKANPELLCDCTSLVRPGVREGRKPGADPGPETA